MSVTEKNLYHHPQEPLSQLADRLSHAMRTPLAVVAGIFDDLLKGFTLTREDFEDGKSSLEKILDLTQVLADFQTTTSKEETVKLGEAIASESRHRHDNFYRHLRRESFTNLSFAKRDAEIFLRSIRRFYENRSFQTSGGSCSRKEVFLLIEEDFSKHEAKTFYLSTHADLDSRLNRLVFVDPEQWVLQDQSVPALQLLIMARCLKNYQGVLNVADDSSDFATLQFRFLSKNS